MKKDKKDPQEEIKIIEDKTKTEDLKEIEYVQKELKYEGPRAYSRGALSNIGSLIFYVGISILSLFIIGIMIISGNILGILSLGFLIPSFFIALFGALKFGIAKSLIASPHIDKVGYKKIIFVDTDRDQYDIKGLLGINRAFYKNGRVLFSELHKAGVSRFNEEFVKILNLKPGARALFENIKNWFIVNLVIFTEGGLELIVYAIVPYNFEEIITQSDYLIFKTSIVSDKKRWFAYPEGSKNPKRYVTYIGFFDLEPYDLSEPHPLRNEHIRDLFSEVGRTSSVYNRIDLLEAQVQAFNEREKNYLFIIDQFSKGREGVRRLIELGILPKGYFSEQIGRYDQMSLINKINLVFFIILIGLLVYLVVFI